MCNAFCSSYDALKKDPQNNICRATQVRNNGPLKFWKNEISQIFFRKIKQLKTLNLTLVKNMGIGFSTLKI